MKDTPGTMKPYEDYISLTVFMNSFNQNMPENFPKVSEVQLLQFKKEHPAFFKHGNLWSLDIHRKKIIDWLPLNKTREQS
jgi:hypothetical protein